MTASTTTAVQDQLAELRALHLPGVTDPGDWLRAAARTGDREWDDAWHRFGTYDRDQLAVMLGWSLPIDDQTLLARLTDLRRIQAEHAAWQPIVAWLGQVLHGVAKGQPLAGPAAPADHRCAGAHCWCASETGVSEAGDRR